MSDIFVHTLIGVENHDGGLLLCGLNHGYSKDDALQDAMGIDRSDPYKSFFSDSQVNDYPFRNKVVSWFSLWGYELAKSKEKISLFEKSIVQTNWLQTCSNHVRDINVRQACISDNEAFLNTCTQLKPHVILFFGKDLLSAFTSEELSTKISSIFGPRMGGTTWIQKNVFYNGTQRRRFRVGFQRYEKLVIVSLPHPTGSQGLADDYIQAFKPEMAEIIDAWWTHHKDKISK